MKVLSALVFLQCLLLPAVCKADLASVLIKSYANSLNLPITDAVREYIYKNSDHGEGTWNQAHGNDHIYVMDQLYRIASGDTPATRPQLLCGNRATVMQALLQNLGIRSRTIYLFSRYSGSLMGHVFVEVMNPETGAWEIQDPDYNVAYENTSGHRLNASQMIAAPEFTNIYPVNANAKGWTETGADRLMIGQFFSLAYSPTEGMLYYNQQALDSGLVAATESYIRSSYGTVNYTPALVGQFLIRPLIDLKNGVYTTQTSDTVPP